MKNMIEVSHLSIHFNKGHEKVIAVDDLSFNVLDNQSLGIVGESGSGKSTVLRAICGLNSHWQGEIRVDQQVQTNVRSKAFYKNLQMVFQDPFASLHPRHTINNILSEPLQIHGIDSHDKRIRAVLDQVNLSHKFRYRYPHQLSGGQRQRIAIARVLLLQPKILLLDEPTSALDVSIQAEILNLLTQLKQQFGLTYVLVSHDLSVIAHMCDTALVMRKGRLVEQIKTASFESEKPQHEYTEQLILASKGYDAKAIESFHDEF